MPFLFCIIDLSKTASLKFAVRGGSAAEKYEEKGSAHLWASVAFAGTGKQSGLRLMRNLENSGVTVRANAHRERIVWSSSSDASVADFAVSSIAESIMSPPRDNYVITENLRIAEYDRQQLATSPRLQITEVTHHSCPSFLTSTDAPRGSVWRVVSSWFVGIL